MKKNTKLFIRHVLYALIFCYYITGIPGHIVLWGIKNNIQGFNTPGADFAEMYSTLGIVWLFGNALLTALIWAIYSIWQDYKNEK